MFILDYSNDLDDMIEWREQPVLKRTSNKK
jgi:hypothetical protein